MGMVDRARRTSPCAPSAGIDALRAKLRRARRARPAAGRGSVLLSVRPTPPGCPRSRFFVYLGVNWWATWYPGAEPGGGGYVAQRIFSAKDERHWPARDALVQHRALRPAAVAVDPHRARLARPLPEPRRQGIGLRPTLMDPSVFPPSLRGLMLAAFAAAYMSTIGTQLNWGASYLVNDFYRRFLRRSSPEREYVVVSQIVTVALMLVSIYVTLLPRVDRAGVEAADRDRRRHRHACCCCAGSGGASTPGRKCRRWRRPPRCRLVSADRARVGRRQAARLRVPHARHRRRSRRSPGSR